MVSLQQKKYFPTILIASFKSSSLVISEDLSITDINVTYYATTIQALNTDFFGGNYSRSPMFGTEKTFCLRVAQPLIRNVRIVPPRLWIQTLRLLF